MTCARRQSSAAPSIQPRFAKTVPNVAWRSTRCICGAVAHVEVAALAAVAVAEAPEAAVPRRRLLFRRPQVHCALVSVGISRVLMLYFAEDMDGNESETNDDDNGTDLRPAGDNPAAEAANDEDFRRNRPAKSTIVPALPPPPLLLPPPPPPPPLPLARAAGAASTGGRQRSRFLPETDDDYVASGPRAAAPMAAPAEAGSLTASLTSVRDWAWCGLWRAGGTNRTREACDCFADVSLQQWRQLGRDCGRGATLASFHLSIVRIVQSLDLLRLRRHEQGRRTSADDDEEGISDRMMQEAVQRLIDISAVASCHVIDYPNHELFTNLFDAVRCMLNVKDHTTAGSLRRATAAVLSNNRAVVEERNLLPSTFQSFQAFVSAVELGVPASELHQVVLSAVAELLGRPIALLVVDRHASPNLVPCAPAFPAPGNNNVALDDHTIIFGVVERRLFCALDSDKVRMAQMTDRNDDGSSSFVPLDQQH
jgi:hypothetical protein